jgi:deferrochelatase/peroxidase EfeB
MSDSEIDFDDVQGILLRGYRVAWARHFVLSITDPRATGQLIEKLLHGSDGLPKLTTARRVVPKPACFLNVSFTCSGLATLGVSAKDLTSFDASFQRGATDASVARNIGDVGSSAPENWIGGLDQAAQVHMLLSLWVTDSTEELASVSARLRLAFDGCVRELSAHDASALPDNKVHFGYRDSISQPHVQGAPDSKHPVDQQPQIATGEFLLGYPNETHDGVYSVSPPALSINSSYAAFRILEQDVAAFEALLSDLAPLAQMNTEMLAAKICGRWRNGNPLELAPTEQGDVLPRSALNNFSYVSTDPASDDTLGLKCPIGSHIRRNNPRNAGVIGTDSSHHRIVRRAMPYGPAYDPQQPDATPRGLVGYFINASLQNQFEFLTSQWNDTDSFVKSATGPGGSDAGNAVFNISGQDVFLGVNDPAESSFTLSQPGKNGSKNTDLTGFGRTITTRGGVYCFFPSINGLRYLATLARPQ